jgi:phage terminase large subunit-like protein
MPPSKKQIVVYGGLDLAPKHDSTGLVFVTRQGDELILARHHLWVPTPERPLHLPDVKQAIYQAAHDLTFGGLLVDPYQAHGLIAELRRDGLPVAEYPQTVANLTRMGQALLDALTQQRLRLYPDATFRQQALNTVAIESPRGFRISKTTGGRKIDLIVALAMAVVAALDSADVHIISAEEEAEMSWQEQRLMRAAGFEIPRENEVVDDEAHWERGDDLSAWAWRRFDGERWHSLW